MFSMRSGTVGEPAGLSAGAGFNPFRFIRRVVVLLFALIQGVLVARIILDLGIIPSENSFGVFIAYWSETLAAPVQGVAGLGGLFGGGVPLPGMPGMPGMPGIPGIPGMPEIPGMPTAPDPASTGLNMVMIAALAGWTVVEMLVMRFVNKLQQV